MADGVIRSRARAVLKLLELDLLTPQQIADALDVPFKKVLAIRCIIQNPIFSQEIST